MANGHLEAHRRDVEKAAAELRERIEEFARADQELRAQPSGDRHPAPDATEAIAATQARDEAAKRLVDLLKDSPLSMEEQSAVTGFPQAELARLRHLHR